MRMREFILYACFEDILLYPITLVVFTYFTGEEERRVTSW